MTQPKLRHVYLPGCWKKKSRCAAVFFGIPIWCSQREGHGTVVWWSRPARRAGEQQHEKHKGQPKVSRSNRHRASLGPNGTGRGRLKNKHTHHQCIMDYRFVASGGTWGYDSGNKCFRTEELARELLSKPFTFTQWQLGAVPAPPWSWWTRSLINHYPSIYQAVYF